MRSVADIVNASDVVSLKGDGSEVFVDVGSGRGHAVFGAAASLKWARCIGVELVQPHVEQANKALEKLKSMEEANGGKQLLPTACSNIEFICADALTDERTHECLKQATFVFCFDMAFPSHMRVEFARNFAKYMKDDALVLTMHTDPFPSTEYVPVLPPFTITMEWGPAPCRLYKKGPGAFEEWLTAHKPQLELANVPETLWTGAFTKLLELNFDIGSYANFARIGETSPDMVMIATSAMPKESVVFVVDHAWTFASKQDAEKSLEQVAGLYDRLWALCDSTAKPAEDASNDFGALLKAAHTLLGSYTIMQQSPDQEGTPKATSFYYMLDEIGSRIRRHKTGPVSSLQSGPANMKLIPLYSLDYRMAFSLAWPIVDIEEGTILVADHEQGWDLDNIDGSQALKETSGVDDEGSMLPEMKEYNAQIKLKQMMQDQAEAFQD